MWRTLIAARRCRPAICNIPRRFFVDATFARNAFREWYPKLPREHPDPSIKLAGELMRLQTMGERMLLIADSNALSESELRLVLKAISKSTSQAIQELAGKDATQVPPALLLYLLSGDIESREDALRLWHLVEARLRDVSPDVKCCLMMSSALRLPAFGLIDVPQQLVKEMIESSDLMPVAAWEELLRLFCRHLPGDVVRPCIVPLLDGMALRKILISRDLLGEVLDRYLAVDVALAAERYLLSHSKVPTVEETRAFVQYLESSGSLMLFRPPVSSFIDRMKATFDHPAFHITNDLAVAASHQELITALGGTGSLPWKWLYVAVSPTMKEAINRLRAVGCYVPMNSSSQGRSLDQSNPPDWLSLHLLRTRVTDVEDAISAFHLVKHYYATTTEPLRTCFLCLSVYWCAKFGAVAVIRYNVRLFLMMWDKPSELHYDFFLCSLSYAPQSKEIGVLIKTVLQTMDEKKISASSITVDRLFGDVCTLDIAEAVEHHLSLQGRHLAPKHLIALISLLSRENHRKKSANYMRTMRRAHLKQGSGPIPVGPDLRHAKNAEITPADRVYMQSFKKYAALRRYVMLMAKKIGEGIPWSTHTNNRDSRSLYPLYPGDTSGTGESPVAERNPENGGSRVVRSTNESDAAHASAPVALSSQLSIKDWTATMHVAARDKNVSAHHFISMFRTGVTKMRVRPTLVTYHVIVRGLLAKDAPVEALTVWRELQASGLPMDTAILGLGIVILTYNGLADRAFALLERVYSRQGKPAIQRRRCARERQGLYVNTIAVNQFMLALSRNGRPDVVYELWLNMERLYGTRPDIYTFNILLRTARWAMKLNESVRGVLVEWGLMKPPDPVVPSFHTFIRDGEVVRIHMMLNPDIKRRVSGFWEGRPAGKVALRLAYDILMHNWPELKPIRSPVRALRISPSSQLESPITDAFNSFRGGPKSLPTLEDTLPQLPEAANAMVQYSRIVPTDITFRLIIDLLEVEELNSEIPLVLAWMRALNIRPSRTTLATALIYWSKVSTDAPLIEALKGRDYCSPYEQLVNWLKEWVGENNMPREREMWTERARVQFYSEANYRDIIAQRSERL